MKRVDAIVKPHQLDALKLRLDAAFVHGITVAEILGAERENGHANVYRGARCAPEFAPSLQITVVAAEDRVASIVDAILEVAGGDRMENGTIAVTSVEEVIRIRTGARGRSAL